jgi:hypothetical protein
MAPAMGYMVGIRAARLQTTHLPMEHTLTARVKLVGVAGPLAQYETQLVEGDRAYISAVLSTFHLPESRRGKE